MCSDRARGARQVFCAECTNNFDYKSLGAYWSHAVSGMPGGITRLMACDDNQLRNYNGLNLGPTFVHRNHGRINHVRDDGEKAPFGSRKSDSSPSYNKAASIMHWVQESEEAKHVDYVLYIDADMLLRLPMDPVKMGVKPGVVVSEHVGYLDVGLRNGLAFQFLPPEAAHISGDDVDDHSPAGPEGKKHAAGGWYHFFHIGDIRKIAHRWLYYCEKMRMNPQLYWKMVDPNGVPGGTDHDIITGDAYVSHGTAPWISEMYGYVFAAGEAGLRHILTHGVVVYPDEIGAGQPNEPSIIHYGLHCTVGVFHFTKYTHGMFNAVGCTGELFGNPPLPSHLERLCAETVLTLNDAMCDYYGRSKAEGGCGFGEIGKTVPTCPAWQNPKPKACADRNTECTTWARAGECSKNAGFMLGNCPLACDACGGSYGHVPAWQRGLAIASGGEAPPLNHPRGIVPGTVAERSSKGLGGDNAAVPRPRQDRDGGGAATDSLARLAKLKGASHAALTGSGRAGRRGLRPAGGGNATASRPRGSAPDALPTRGDAPRRRAPAREEPTDGLAKATEAPAASDSTAAGGEADGATAAGAGAAVGAGTAADGADAGAADGDAADASSMETLRWQMYVGWGAVLGLCALLLGRRLCRRARPKGGAKLRGV